MRWAESMRLLIERGATHWVEVGAGAVLTGLLRNIDPAQTCQKFGKATDQIDIPSTVSKDAVG